ncbi:MAG: aspartyl/asparaginyl beta-hydroxylase domain-containing protein [Bdellovibrionales bacterium]|nr:aspartyl/asparaginyl beta-hydroxylase domain-containing protein [Bdellovibrionales bacterium]
MSDSQTTLQTIHPNDLYARGRLLDFDVLRVPYGFSKVRLERALARVQANFPWSGKDGEDLYQAIGLQYSALNVPKGDQPIPPEKTYLDAVDRKATYEYGEGYDKTYDSTSVKVAKLHAPFRFFDRLNPAGARFDFVFQRLLPFRLYRTRLMTIFPGFELPDAHIDGKLSVRLHIPIETNPDSWIEISGRRYHLPSDGSGYLINTSRPHRVGNNGTSPRTHLVSILYQNGAGPLHPIAVNAIRDFYEQYHGLDGKTVADVKAACRKLSQERCEICQSTGLRLYEIPSKDASADLDLLRSLCSNCIENLCRPIASRLGTEGEALNEFKFAIASACRAR